MSVQKIGMADAPDMPELDENLATGIMNRIGHFAPAGYLFRSIEARGVLIALGQFGNLGGFGDDETGGCALAVVKRGKGTGHQTAFSPAAGQRGHDNTVGKLDIAQRIGLKQYVCH